jgi:hypothetical protein
MKVHPKKGGAARKGPKINTSFKEGDQDDDREDYLSESEGEFGGSVHAQSAGEDDEVLDSNIGIDLRGKSLKNTQKKQSTEIKKDALPLKAILKQILDRNAASIAAKKTIIEGNGKVDENAAAEVRIQ